MEGVWEERKDPSTGRKYYYNKVLRQTAWTKPTGSAEEAQAWTRQVDSKTGDVFWYNTVTKVRSVVNPVLPDNNNRNNQQNNINLQSPPDLEKTLTSSHRSLFSGSNSNITGNRKSKNLFSGGGTKKVSLESNDFANYDYEYEQQGNVEEQILGYENNYGSTNQRRHKSIKLGADNFLQAGVPGSPNKNFSKIDTLARISAKKAPTESNFEKLRRLRRDFNDEYEYDHDGNRFDKIETLDLDNLIATNRKNIEEDYSVYSFEAYAASHFQVKSAFFGPKVTFDSLICYQRTPLKKSLHGLKVAALEKKAVTCFKLILAFSDGDTSSNKKPEEIAQDILELGIIDSVEELRDEIFCQLIKQTQNNPSELSTLRVFQLIALCCGAFPPSLIFLKTLKNFLLGVSRAQNLPAGGPNNAIGNSSAETSVRNFVEYGKLRLDKSIEKGPRAQVPSMKEIECSLMRKPMEVSVFLVNGTKLDLQAETWTTVKELRAVVGKHLRIKDVTIFALIEVSEDSSEYVLPLEDKILDFTADWELEYKQYKNPNMAPKNYFVFRIRLFVAIDETDRTAIELAYYQAVFDVTDSRYPVGVSDCVRLIALQAQERFGDFDGKDPFGTAEEFRNYLPLRFKGDENKVRAEVVAQYEELQGLSAFQAMKNYLDYVQKWPSYGCQVFPVEPLNNPEYPKKCYLAVNARAVFVINPSSKQFLAEFQWGSIVTWGYSEQNFCLVYGNFLQQMKLFFKTPQALEAYKLVESYGNRIKGYGKTNEDII